MRRLLRRWLGKGEQPSRPDRLNALQELFCEWNAVRLGISVAESRERFVRSWNAIPGGHRGDAFRTHCVRAHEILGVFFDDNEREVYDAYVFHGYAHFLRMLSYGPARWDGEHVLVHGLSGREDVTILDFGCGLAHRSRALGQALQDQGKRVHLVLADIPTIRKPFLLWLGERSEIPVTFLDCTSENPMPKLPPCDVAIVIEVFEHLHAPVQYLRWIHEALSSAGLLLTDVADREPGFMHVSPNLQVLRDEIGRMGYEELKPNVLFRKPDST